jgi:uncharacterized protein YkwD
MRAIVIVVLAALAPALLLSAQPTAAGGNCTPDPSWGTLNRQFEAEVVQIVNNHRQSIGVQPVAVSPALRRSAEWKALHMAGFGYFGHNDPAPPVNRDPFQRMKDCGYTTPASLAENIASGQSSPADVVQAWLTSDGHRRNIENPEYVVIGVGAARLGNGPTYWVQNFGSFDDSGSGTLFEGWNRITWEGPSVTGLQAVRAALEQLTGGAWQAVAVFNGGWQTAYEAPPLPSMNTLDAIATGQEAWVYVPDDVTLP